MGNTFFGEEEDKICSQFLKDGFVIVPLDQDKNDTLIKLRKTIYDFSKDYLKLPPDLKENEFFDQVHKYIDVAQLNDFKLGIMGLVARERRFHPGIYHLAKKYIDYIVGNELCMQRGLNLSIQLPKDDSALLPLHTDVWSGNSPYEVVLWLPLVDCYKTKSMYVLPLDKSKEVYANFSKFEQMDAEAFYKALEKDLVFLDVPKGHAVVFSHAIIHGNRVNLEADTRWTFNIRFKALLSPFGMKDLGETFVPVMIRPITRIGHENKLPEIAR